MNAISSVKTTSTLMPVLAMAVIGATMLFLVGHAQSATLHDAAHDVRHSLSFPCH